MKLKSIIVLLSLSIVVRGSWWVAAAKPVMISLGAVLTAINQDVLDL